MIAYLYSVITERRLDLADSSHISKNRVKNPDKLDELCFMRTRECNILFPPFFAIHSLVSTSCYKLIKTRFGNVYAVDGDVAVVA